MVQRFCGLPRTLSEASHHFVDPLVTKASTSQNANQPMKCTKMPRPHRSTSDFFVRWRSTRQATNFPLLAGGMYSRSVYKLTTNSRKSLSTPTIFCYICTICIWSHLHRTVMKYYLLIGQKYRNRGIWCGPRVVPVL